MNLKKHYVEQKKPDNKPTCTISILNLESEKKISSCQRLEGAKMKE